MNSNYRACADIDEYEDKNKQGWQHPWKRSVTKPTVGQTNIYNHRVNIEDAILTF